MIKDDCIKQIEELDPGELCVKRLAAILNCSTSRIYRDLKEEIFPGASRNGRGTKSSWCFSKEDAIEYVKDFEESTPKDLTPESKQLPFSWD